MSTPETSPQRRRLASGLLTAAEVSLVALLVGVTLLYTPRLADNVLGKTALVHAVAGWTVLLWAAGRAAAGGLSWVASPLTAPFLLLLAAGAVAGVVRATSPALAFEHWLLWAQWLALLVATGDLARDAGRAWRLLATVFVTAVAVSLLALLQVVGVDPLGLPPRFAGMPLATLGNTNFVAHYLELVVPLAIALAVSVSWPARRRALAAAAALTGGVVLVLAGSRGGWLGVGTGLLLMLVAGPRRRGWLRGLLLGCLVAALLSPVAGFVLESIPAPGGGTARQAVERTVDEAWAKMMTTFDEDNFSRSMRMLMWRDSLRVIRDQPLLGVGPGHYGIALPGHRSSTGQREWRELMENRANEPNHAHNELLETWIDSGLAGLASLVWLLAAALWLGYRTAVGLRATPAPEDGRRDPDLALALGCLGALVAAAVHALFSFNLRDPVSGTHVWLVAGLLLGVRGRQGIATVAAVPLPGVARRLPVMAVGLLLAVAGGYHGLCMLRGDGYYLRARQHLAAGHGNRAILALRHAIDWRDHMSLYHQELGRVAFDMGRPGEAAEALARSVELHPNNPSAIRLYGRAALALGQPARALEAAEHAVDIAPLSVDNYVVLADLRRAVGQPSEAVLARRQAISLGGSPNLLLDLAFDHLAGGHLDSALAVLEQAAHTAPRDGLIRGNLGALQLQAGQPEVAGASLRQALELAPGHADEWRGNLALALLAQGQSQAALEQAEMARAVAPQDPRWQQLVERLRRIAGPPQERPPGR